MDARNASILRPVVVTPRTIRIFPITAVFSPTPTVVIAAACSCIRVAVRTAFATIGYRTIGASSTCSHFRDWFVHCRTVVILMFTGPRSSNCYIRANRFAAGIFGVATIPSAEGKAISCGSIAGEIKITTSRNSVILTCCAGN